MDSRIKMGNMGVTAKTNLTSQLRQVTMEVTASPLRQDMVKEVTASLTRVGREVTLRLTRQLQVTLQRLTASLGLTLRGMAITGTLTSQLEQVTHRLTATMGSQTKVRIQTLMAVSCMVSLVQATLSISKTLARPLALKAVAALQHTLSIHMMVRPTLATSNTVHQEMQATCRVGIVKG